MDFLSKAKAHCISYNLSPNQALHIAKKWEKARAKSKRAKIARKNTRKALKNDRCTR